jgi:hypothetical protein
MEYTKWSENDPKEQQNIPESSIARASKIYPSLDFWFENKPSGNPG